MRDWTTKDLRKAAFAVGFGLTVGKAVGGFVEAALNGVVVGVIKNFANHGNEIAQEICEKQKIKYEPKSKEDKPKMKIGFHCE